MKIAIVGAGLIGRLLAWYLCQQPAEVHVFSEDSLVGEKSCSAMAAGMIAPYSELPHLTKEWQILGIRSLELWPNIITQLNAKIFYQATGTLWVSHTIHQNLLTHFIKNYIKDTEVTLLTHKEVYQYEKNSEPLLGYYIPHEACIDPLPLLSALATFVIGKGVVWHPHTRIKNIRFPTLYTDQNCFKFDQIIDCRGLGSKLTLTGLRGIRGDLMTCYAPHLQIKHMIRLMHPRTPCYIVPRDDDIYVIGATQIETETSHPITVENMLKLLGAATQIHKGFYNAHIIETKTGLRPTLLHSHPLIEYRKGILHLNGFFRHGFLLAPAILEKVTQWIFNTKKEKELVFS